MGAARHRGNHRRDEFVEREDGGGGKPGKHHDRLAARRRQADRLAWLERHTVRDDAGRRQFRDDPVRHVTGAFACASRQQHDVRTGERLLQLPVQGIHVVVNDTEAQWLAAELTHRIGQNLRIRIEHARRLHRCTRRNDLVPSGEDRDHRAPPDVDAGDTDGGQHTSVAARQHLPAPKYRLPTRDVGAGKRHAAPGRDGPSDAQADP